MKKQVETTEKQKYINREISWLHFNNRVLQESKKSGIPLIERLKFLGIFSNNLDEFFRVRVATLQRMKEMDMKSKSVNDKPKTILKKISNMTSHIQTQMEDSYTAIKQELEREGICIVDESMLNAKQRDFVKLYYNKKLEDAITPIMISDNAEFPELEDARIYFVVELLHNIPNDDKKFALIEVPGNQYPRFLVLPETDGKKYIILLDDVIRLCMPMLFRSLGYETFKTYAFKITRDSEMEIKAELGEGIVNKVSKGIKSRRFGSPLRFLYDKEMPKELLEYLLDKIEFNKSGTIIAGGRYHNFKNFMSFPKMGRTDLVYPEREPVENRELKKATSLISAIEQKDYFLHYPYYNFSQYVQLLREAAIDPEVKSIYMTIYRMASRSKVAKALIYAAKNGKEVTAVVELRARFDEEHNIQWARRMEEAGVNVVFGVEGLKIHSKLTLIKKTKNRMVAAVSTGNFHEGNAAVYTDFTLLTAKTALTYEINKVFEYIRQPFQNQRFNHLLVSPIEMRKKLYAMIRNEVIHAQKGLPAYILCKINHITDYKFIDKLYTAAEAGVKVKIVLRGMCCMNPTLERLHENIEIVSIIDKYLEHSRIFIFCNNGIEKYYISSADWMTRNLDHRIEVAAPIYDKTIQRELKTIIEYGLADNVQGRITDGTGENRDFKNDKAPFRSQEELMKHYIEIEEGTK